MMMGGVLLVIFLLLVVLIGLPLLIVAMVTGGGLAALLRPRPQQKTNNMHLPTPIEPTYIAKCPTCGRGVKADWNVCPSCGAALT